MALKVTVFADYVCPYCYLAKRRIDQLEAEFDITVDWKGFELRPAGTPQPEPDSLYMQRVRQNLEWVLEDEGVKLSPPSGRSPSGPALEATEYAITKGKFGEFHRAVYDAYWLEGKRIDDVEVLVSIGRKIGLDEGELRASLDGHPMRDKLLRNRGEAEIIGISGVPTFFIGAVRITGVQPYEVFRKAAVLALSQAETNNELEGGRE